MKASLSPEQEELRNAVADLDAVELEINKRLQPLDRPSREVLFKLTEAFVFKAGDMKVQRKTFVNGAEDLYLTYPNFAALVEETLTTNVSLVDSEAGLALPVGESIYAGTLFDFLWNYSIASQGEKYASSANNVSWLSRKSLGNKDRNLELTFDPTVRLKGGDSITFFVRPIMYDVSSGFDGTLQFVVNMTMYGRRDGRMAESAYDADFRSGYRQRAEARARKERKGGRR